MPLINVKLIEGVFSPAQKSQMIKKLTDAMVEIEGENMRQVTSVVVDEERRLGHRGPAADDVRRQEAPNRVIHSLN